ncbi:MAG TPA: hypothetical protein VLS45_08320 [Methylomicrobium sp.]|nr:hypothetical protein [Methylomicrobium sp.]
MAINTAQKRASVFGYSGSIAAVCYRADLTSGLAAPDRAQATEEYAGITYSAPVVVADASRQAIMNEYDVAIFFHVDVEDVRRWRSRGVGPTHTNGRYTAQNVQSWASGVGAYLIDQVHVRKTVGVELDSVVVS